MGVADKSEAKKPEIHANQTCLLMGVADKSEAKKNRNSRKLNQSINGCSHDFQMIKTISLCSIV